MDIVPRIDTVPTASPAYRTTYTVGSRWVLFGMLFFALGLVFALLPTSGGTVFLSVVFFVFAFAFWIAHDCCCDAWVRHSVVNNHGVVHGLLPYVSSTVFGTYTVVVHGNA